MTPTPVPYAETEEGKAAVASESNQQAGAFPVAKPEDRYTGKPPATETKSVEPTPAPSIATISEKTKAEQEAGRKALQKALGKK